MQYPLPINRFKRGLAEGRPQLGFWCTLPDSYATEISAGAGFDWLLFDTEHSPNDPITVLPQLQAAAAYDVSAVVRPAGHDPVLLKRFLDLGAQSLLIPYVQTPQEAAALVAAVRYPPRGFRGVAAVTRASRFGRVKNYLAEADSEICLLVQVETQSALDRLEAIAAVDGVDGIFIGPADLAASMGFIGKADHPKVVEAIETAIGRSRAIGKPVGTLAVNEVFARRCIELGSSFTAVGVDAGLLARNTEALAARFRS